MMLHSDAMNHMDDQEFMGNLGLLIVGGNDTTRNTISGLVYALDKFPNPTCASLPPPTARDWSMPYRAGIDNYLGSLDAQRSLYSAQQAQVAVRLALVANRIALYRALGGDQASEPTLQK